MTYAITKSHVECYKLRRFGTGDGWADITLDVNGNAGRIQIASDYGSWEYYWGACGCPFKQFLIDLSDNIHYTAGKFGEGKWFDQEATMAQLRKDIEEWGDGDEEKETMREELAEMEDCMEVNSFCHLAYNADTLHKLWDTGPHIHYDVSPMFRQFWEKVWPVFVAELKKEIEADAGSKSPLVFDPKMLLANTSDSEYFIGTDTCDKQAMTTVLLRRKSGVVDILLYNRHKDEAEFKQEVANLAKYFNAQPIQEV